MSVKISNTEITQTFDYWRNRTNELAWAMHKVVLTTDGSLSPSDLVANSVAEGNTRITGTFSANVFSANQNITANTSISVNTAVISPSTTTSFSLINATTISVGNVTENSVLTGSSLSTRGLTIASNVVINTTSYFIGDFNSNTVISKENVVHRANTLVNSVSNSTTLKFSNDSVNSTLTFNSLIIGEATVNSVGVFSGSGVFRANGTSLNANGIIVNSSGVYANGLVNAANFTTTGTVNTATVFATGIVNAASFTTTGSVNTATVYATGLVNAANFTTTGTVNTGTVYATGLVNAANFVTTGTVNTDTVFATGRINAASFTTTGTVNTGTVFATGLVNAANFTTTGTVNTGTVFATGVVNASGFTTTGAVNTGTILTTGLINAFSLNVRNQTNTETLYVNSVTTLNGNTTMSGTWANVTGDLRVMGNLTVNGSLSYTGVSNADIVPDSNSFNLGSTTKRWTLYSLNIDNAQNTVSNNVIVTNVVNAASYTVGSDFIANSTGVYHTGVVNATSYRVGNVTTGTGGSVQNTTTMFVGNNIINTVITSAGLNVNSATIANSTGVFTGTVNAAIIRTGAIGAETNSVYIDSNFIFVGNSSVNATVNSTVYSKTANNTLFVGSTAAAAVVNSSQLSANLSNYAPLATGANFTGAVSVVNNVTISGNLVVTGTTIYANVNNLDVKDLNITLAKDAPTVASTDGAGITIDVSNIGFYYHRTSNTWQSNVGYTPSTNNAFNLGTTDLRWSAVFANNITLTNSVSAALVSASNVSATDLYGTVRTATQGTIDHNSLANYDANRHIDHTAVSITAGNGLSGGGTIAATRTLNVSVGNNQLISNSTGIWANQSNFDHNSLSNYDANRHVDHTAVSITAGNGLTGGGTIAATRTLNVLANTGIVSNSSGVFANATYIQSLVNVTNGSIVTSGTSAQNVDSFLISSFIGAEYLISVSDNSANNRYVTKTLVMHDGSTAQITEYGSITSNNSVGLFSATQNTTHIVLQFTPSLSATTVKYTRTVV